MANERKPEEMTEEEIAEADGEPLPDRQAMSVIRGVEPLPPLIGPGAGDIGFEPLPPEN